MTTTARTSPFAEAERQLNICNSCRYCEGYCAVFPALERRRALSAGDLEQLANLCHDCRACLYACMYAPPHEFAINPPKVLAEVRLGTLAPGGAISSPGPGRRRLGSTAGLSLLVSAAVVVALAAATEGIGHLWSGGAGTRSPYSVISYPAILALMGAAAVFAVAVFGAIGARYWRRTRGPLRDLLDLAAWRAAIVDAATLRNLKGGGAECQYPNVAHSPLRRYLHGAVAYGFSLCLVSTIAAGTLQDIAGVEPPYSWASVPVVSGAVGGIGLVIGSVGLAVLKMRADPEATASAMTPRDYHLLVVLALLGATGLATLVTRTAGAYGLVLTVHLATVAAAFVLAPFSKFGHVVYRTLALVQDHVERNQPDAPVGPRERHRR